MKNKKILKQILRAAAVLAGMLLIVAGIFVYLTRYKIGDIDASVSPSGEYEVIYQSVGEPDWPFGYSHARILLKQKNRTVTKFRFDIANDGGILYPDSWQVRWTDTCVRVIVSGEEQYDVLYTLIFDGTVSEETLGARGAGFGE